MRFLGDKTTDLIFSAITAIEFWVGASDVSSANIGDAPYIFLKYLGQTTHRCVVCPIKLKKRHVLEPGVVGPSAGRCFIRPG